MYGKPVVLFDNIFSNQDTAPFLVTNMTDGSDYANMFDFRSYTSLLTKTNPGDEVQRVELLGAPMASSADFLYVKFAESVTDATIILSSDDGINPGTTHVYQLSANGDEFLFFFPQHVDIAWRFFHIAADPKPVSHLILGKKLELPRHLHQGFDPLGGRPRGRVSKSAKGHPLGTAESWREWKQRISFKNIDASWLRNTWKPAFDGHLKHTPSVFVWDPVQHVDELYLIHPIFQYNSPHVQGQFAHLDFTVEGLAE